MKKVLRCVKTLATGLALASLIAGTAQAADTTIRIAHLNPADPYESHSGTMTAVFKQLVETASKGEISVKLFPNGQLGKDNEVIAQVRQGIIESAISSAGGVAQHYPLVGVFDIPFAFPNIGVASEVITLESEFGQKFAADLNEKTGLKVLGLIDSGGFFQFTNSEHPIKSVEDMESLKIRTMTLPTHEAMISSLGAKPTPLPWAEVYTALQTGVAEGQMNPVVQIAFAKFGEVQDYLTISNHVITPYVWFMNEEFYNGLSDEHQRIVDWASQVATEAGRGMSRAIEAQKLPQLKEKMEVNVLSAEARQNFAETAQPAVRKLIKEKYGEEGIEMLEAMLDSIDKAKARQQ